MSSEPHTEFIKRVNDQVTARFAVSAAVADEVDQILRAKGQDCHRHGNCQAVVILAVDEEVYRVRREKNGAEPIKDWWFPSARAASAHFGYSYNAVAQALAVAKQRGEASAQIGGVQVAWADHATTRE